MSLFGDRLHVITDEDVEKAKRHTIDKLTREGIRGSRRPRRTLLARRCVHRRGREGAPGRQSRGRRIRRCDESIAQARKELTQIARDKLALALALVLPLILLFCWVMRLRSRSQICRWWFWTSMGRPVPPAHRRFPGFDQLSAWLAGRPTGRGRSLHRTPQKQCSSFPSISDAMFCAGVRRKFRCWWTPPTQIPRS